MHRTGQKSSSERIVATKMRIATWQLTLHVVEDPSFGASTFSAKDQSRRCNFDTIE